MAHSNSPQPRSENPNRTLVCSVLFLDIEGYSKKSVNEQLNLKRQFNAVLSTALSHVGADARIVLDTGDGAAVCFLSDPEDSLFAAINVRNAIALSDPGQTTPMRLRIGINIGPVRLLNDINGQVNIIGDGINDAQRVMSFAEPGKILVSRSYFEIVSRLSDDYSRLFVREGVHTDKHVREHEVYAVGISTSPMRGYVASPVGEQPSRDDSASSWQTPTVTMGAASDQSRPKEGTRKQLVAVLVAMIVIAGAATSWFMRSTTTNGIDNQPEPTKPKVSAPAPVAEIQTSTKKIVSQPEPTKPKVSAPAGKAEIHAPTNGSKEIGSAPDWLIALRKEIALCEAQGFLPKVFCVDKVRRKYCEPSHWGEVEECLVRRTEHS